MESKSEVPDELESLGIDPMQNLPNSKFQRRILKAVIGENAADKVLQSLSMAVIPSKGPIGTLGKIKIDNKA